jgi:uncharacterized protein YrrD
MDLGLGKRVVSQDGKHVGHVDGFVVDFTTRELASFVVRSGVFFADDRFVSLDLIDQVDPEGTVSLTLTGDEVHQLPIFVEHKFVTASPDDLENMPQTWGGMGGGVSSVYVGSSIDALGNNRASSFFAMAPVNPPEVETESNLPSQDIVIDRGTDVITSDGTKLGTVDDVITGADGRVSGYIVQAGFLFHHDVAIQAEMIETIGEGHVRLRVTAEELRQEPSPK